MAERGFDGAMISVATPDKLAGCEKLLKTIKNVTTGRLRVAIGGAALRELGEKAETIGADVVTNDLTTAMIGLGMMDAAMNIDSNPHELM